MKKLIGLFATILLFAASAVAQIEGRVTDAKGNGVPKVTVTATGEDGTVAATVTTDEDGNYAFEELSPGKYKITAKGPAGFQPAVRENVNVAEDDTTTLNITLIAATPAPVPEPTVKPVTPPVKPVTPPVSMLDDIINKHINALGGREELLSLKTIRLTGTLTTQGFDVDVTITKSHLIGMRTDINIPGMSAGYRIVTPTKSINFLPFQGQSSPETTQAESSATQTTLDIQSPLLDYRAKGTSVELLGTEKVDGEDSFKLKLTFKSGAVNTCFISSKTYLITKATTKMTINGEPTDMETTYSDYKKNADGYLFAYTTTNPAGVTNFTKIETNIAVDPAIFK